MTLRRRQCQRYTKRLEVIFQSSPGGTKYRGISSDLSAGGIFIRTQNGLNPGTFVDIELYMPYHVVCRLKGIVRRTVKTALSVMKNGMGIEIIERDEHYLTLVKTISQSSEELQEGGEGGEGPERQEPEEAAASGQKEERQPLPESFIISCSACNSKNKVPRQKITLGPRCGRCGEPLPIEGIV